MLYILDEPSAGLHAKDAKPLMKMLKKLRDKGDTVVVIEHEYQILKVADEIIEFGLGAGIKGGQVVYSGKFNRLQTGQTLTGRFLSGNLRIPRSVGREIGSNGWIRIYGARGRNLNIDSVGFPLGNLIGVSGISGSGKTSLVRDTLCPILASMVGNSHQRPLPYDCLLYTSPSPRD